MKGTVRENIDELLQCFAELFQEEKNRVRVWEASAEDILGRIFDIRSVDAFKQRSKSSNSYDIDSIDEKIASEENVKPLKSGNISFIDNYGTPQLKIEPIPETKTIPILDDALIEDMFETREEFFPDPPKNSVPNHYYSGDQEENIPRISEQPLFMAEPKNSSTKKEKKQKAEIFDEPLLPIFDDSFDFNANDPSLLPIVTDVKDVKGEAVIEPKLDLFMEKKEADPYYCSYCSHTSYSNKEHLLHLKRCHSVNKFDCPDCKFTTSRATKLEIHQRKAHGISPKVACSECDAILRDSKSLKDHNRRKHTMKLDNSTGEVKQINPDYDPEDKIICPQCEKKVHRKSMKRHNQLRHEPRDQDRGEKTHKCVKCNFSAYESGGLKKHVRVVHDKIKNVACPQCPYKTINQSSLKIHVRFYHDKIYDNKCDECGHVTPNIYQLRSHIQKVHQKLKPKQCHLCPNSFSETWHLKNHIKIVHEKIANFNCEKCTYKVNHKSLFREHLKEYHNIEEKDEYVDAYHEWKKEKNEYHCEICPYKANWKRKLRQHLKIHKIFIREQDFDEYIISKSLVIQPGNANGDDFSRERIKQPVANCKFVRNSSNVKTEDISAEQPKEESISSKLAKNIQN